MDVAERLRRTRESRGLTLETLSALTKIPVRSLTAIERSEFDRLPGGLFTRGFLRAYAREVGLDADEIVREFLAEAPPPAPVAPRAAEPLDNRRTPFDPEEWTGGFSPGGVLVAFVLLAGLIYFSRTPTPPADGPAAPVPPAVEVASQIGTTAPRAVRTAGEERPGVTLDLVPTGPCWAEASADGRRVLYRLMAAGERASLRAERVLTVRLGDAGACAVSVNGGPARPAGAAGQVRTVTISAAALAGGAMPPAER